MNLVRTVKVAALNDRIRRFGKPGALALFSEMIHTALARKYRPARFADLVSQEHVSLGLAGAVAKNRVAHGYLLAGPRGTGKTTAARILAMALNCERRVRDNAEGEPCGECESCRRVWSGAANLDVVEIDAASNRGVDDARDLRERAMYAASGPDRFKVYIIDEAHMLTREAWNALLKILEEPPPQVVFVFATTEPQKIANTTSAVLSRLQRFDFRNIGPKAIARRLREVAEAEELSIDDDALALIARAAKGGMRDALSIFDQAVVFGDGSVTAGGVREALGLIDEEAYGEVLTMVGQRRSEEVFPFVARLVEQGVDLAEFVNGLGETLRSLMLEILGGEPEGLTEGLREALERVRQDFTAGDVLRMLRLLEQTETSIRRSPNARLHVETLLLHWTLLDRTVEISQVLEALRGGPGGGSARPIDPTPSAGRSRSGTGSPPPPQPPSPAPGGGSTRSSGTAATAPQAAGAAPTGVETLEGLVARWGDLLEFVGQKSPLMRETLAQARPVALGDRELALEVAGGDMQLEGLKRNQGLVNDAVSHLMGRAIRVVFEAASQDQGPDPEVRRHTSEDDRGARLRNYRAQDRALDAVAEALDLELTE